MLYSKRFMIFSYFLTVVTIFYGAQEKNKFSLPKIEEITVVESPWHVRHFSNDEVVISSSSECSIVNLKTKAVQCINRRDDSLQRAYEPILHIHDKNIISSVGEQTIVYNGQMKERQAFLKLRAIDLAVHPCKNIIFLLCLPNILAQFNYDTGRTEDLYFDNYLKMAIHPKKETMCRITSRGDVSFYALNDLMKTTESMSLDVVPRSCQYSPDGSFIAVGSREKTIIIDLCKKDSWSIECNNFRAITFHPNGWLAILDTKKSNDMDLPIGPVIYYYDLKTKNLVYTMSELDIGCSCDLSFSHNGLDVVVALYNKCIRTRVPFAVDNAIKVLWRLNQLKEQGKIPQDILRHCLNVFLGV